MKLKNGWRNLICFCLGMAIGNFGAKIDFQNSTSNSKYQPEVQMIYLESGLQNVEPIETAEVEIVVEPQETGTNQKNPFYKLSNDERYYLTCIVAGEAKGEPMEGKMAVAQCLLNAMVKEDMSPKEIKKKYQYAGWDSNLETQNQTAWNECAEAVERVFVNGEMVSENPILFFYAYKNTVSKWHESLELDAVRCCHKFFYIKSDETADWFISMKNGE